MTKTNSQSTDTAIRHLKKIKPYDGWSADTYNTVSGESLVMLRRRNIPVSDKGFRDILHEPDSGCIVGLKSTNGAPFAIGTVLIEKDGSACRIPRDVRFRVPSSSKPTAEDAVKESLEKLRKQRKEARERVTREEERRRSNDQNRERGEFTDENNQMLLKYAGYGILGLALLNMFAKVATSIVLGLGVFAVPLGIHAALTCPEPSMFDAKKELKRVMRGHHLPDEHQAKPKGWLERTAAKVTASIATELATGLGYEVSMMNMMGVGYLATVKLTSLTPNMEYFWIGAFGKWFFIMQRNRQTDERRT